MPRPLFVLGSKRSGSTLTVHLLNSHPEVFVTHESDIAWLLTQARDGRPERYVPHPLDSDMMLRQTTRVGRRIPRLVRQADPNRKYADQRLPDVPRARAQMERLGYA